MDMRLWAIGCTFLMIMAIILELLTPSMGGFTLGALAMAGASIFLGFKFSDSFGYSMVALNLATFPLALWLGLHFMKRSPLVHVHELTSGSQSSPDAPPLDYLLGQQGQALTTLRPAGAAMIGDVKTDVVTDGKFVEAGTLVKVIHVEGNRVVVEPI